MKRVDVKSSIYIYIYIYINSSKEIDDKYPNFKI